MDAHHSFSIFYFHVYALFFFFAALLILSLRNADARTPRPTSAVAAAAMLLPFLNVGRDKGSYFGAYSLFLAGVALLFLRIWAAAGRHRPARDVVALAIVIVLFIAKLAVAAVFSWFPSEGGKADRRINLEDVSMLSAASIVLNMLAQIM